MPRASSPKEQRSKRATNNTSAHKRPSRQTTTPAQVQREAGTPAIIVRVLARNRVRGRATDDLFVLVCAIRDQRLVDGEWFGKQVYPGEEGEEFGIIVREGAEIHYPAGFWRTNIGSKRIAPGEMFSVFGEDGRNDGDDVWEITHVTPITP